MPDIEKVIKGLETIKSFFGYGLPSTAEMFDSYYGILNDAIAMLKEQGKTVAYWDDDTGHWIDGDRNGTDPSKRVTGEMIDTFRCSWCGFYQYWKTPFCPNCGAPMDEKRKAGEVNG